MKANDERTETYLGVISTDPDKRELRDKGILLLVEEIGETIVREFIRDLSIIKLRKNLKEVTIKICCPGGSVEEGMGMIRMIKEIQKMKIKVKGVVYGQAMSMGFLLLQACDERIMGSGDILMAHGVVTHTQGDTKNIEAERKVMTDIRAWFAVEVAKRNTSKDETYHEPGFWVEVLSDSTPQFYTAQESFEMGLIDKIEGDN